NEILEDEFFESTILSLSIYDLTLNKSLYELNQRLLLRPASNMKIITSIAALEYLGVEYNFNTSVYHTGIILDSVCYGDLVVVGGCDPDFSTEDLDTLVLEVKNFGINEIRGNIYGDVSIMDSLFWGNGWMWDDDPSTNFPYMTPLLINDAAVEIAYEPGLIGNPIRYSIIPESDYFNVTNNTITTKEDTSDLTITRNWIERGNEILLEGDLSYKVKPDTTEINIVRPEYYFLYLLKDKLEKSSIEVLGRLDTLTLPQFSNHIYSKMRPFGNIIDNLNKESDNLSSEMVLRALSLAYFDEPASAEKGIRMIDSLINNTSLESSKYSIVDGSGVSHYNLVSTELIIELLKYTYFQSPENFEVLNESFPVAGIDGTLENRMRRGRAFNNVRAKTGTLSGVSNLSGYLHSANNHNLAFSIFVQNYSGSSRTARWYQDRICKFLSELIISE
ncbi:MAG: D-alanyl-D-alanine carboxypeptidase/D-alanyl-D-alanine-endopeptidase, partial [Melioribacteraceae bacterium]|nr:D-alanyl-D-alanine carboxypeptidase/D-alanyl-D-alanine-endopeptidase [Melioribacteraceae bacterium]